MRLPGVRYLPLLDEGAYLAMGLATRLDEDSPLVIQFLNLMRERWLNARR